MLGSGPCDPRKKGAPIKTPTSEIRTSLVTNKTVCTNSCLSKSREKPRGPRLAVMQWQQHCLSVQTSWQTYGKCGKYLKGQGKKTRPKRIPPPLPINLPSLPLQKSKACKQWNRLGSECDDHTCLYLFTAIGELSVHLKGSPNVTNI